MASINSLSGISGVPLTPQNSNAKLQAAIARLVGLPGLFPTVDNVSGLSTVAKLQAQNADVRLLSGNIAEALSLSQVADSGVSDIQQAVSQLQSLAQQAQASDVTAESRAALNSQFQQVAQQINLLAANTNFNGRSLLDGSLSGDNALSLANVVTGSDIGSGVGDLSIGDLTTSALFGGADLNILTSENASQAIATLGSALESLGSVRSDVNIFQQALDFASANLDSVLANQQAAQSSIRDDEDVTLTSNVQQNAGNAVAAQTSQLSPTLLQLIS